MFSKFKTSVLMVVSKIPLGRNLSYKQVAILSKNKSAYRAVGLIIKNNINLQIPCHRVICSDGKVGSFNRGRDIKIKLLRNEGIKINQKGMIQLS